MPSLYEMSQWANEIVQAQHSGAGTLRDGVIKVAQQHDLSEDDIRILVGRVNRTAIVPLHQKVASQQLGLGATFATVDPDDVCRAARETALRPNMAQPSLPPKVADYSRGRAMFEARYKVAEKAPERPMKDYEDNPALIDVETEPKLLMRIRDHFIKAARDMREEVRDASRCAAQSHAVLHDELEREVRAGTPAVILKRAAAASDFHLDYIDQLKAAIPLREKALPADVEIEIEASHPIIKEASAFQVSMKRAQVAEVMASRLEAIAKSAGHRLFLMESKS